MFELIDMIIVRPIVNILFVIYNFIGDFGFAVIIFTIIVKFLMWPLVKRQLHQTKLMKKIQPELAQIKKNCNGNRQMESLQTMDLYKRYNIKPFRSILTLLIQLPIFIALFTAINVMVRPRETDNVEKRAYSFIQTMDRISPIIEDQKQCLENEECKKNPIAENGYNFKPELFGTVDLSARAGFASVSSVVVLLFALAAAGVQYYTSKQQLPSKKGQKSKKFRDLIKEAAAGKDPDQADMNAMVQNQMSFMMPLMLLLIMINLPGALVLYYLLTNIITSIQQHIIFHKDYDEMDNLADKAILKELKGVKEAEVIKNKKTGTTITRISAKDIKKSKQRGQKS